MAEGLKLVGEIMGRAIEQHGVRQSAYYGIDAAVLVLSNPQNVDLWAKMKAYCEEEMPSTSLREIMDDHA